MNIAIQWIIAVVVFYVVFFVLLPLLVLPALLLNFIKLILVIGAIVWCVKQLQ
jgi:hypothetical protein